MSQAITIGLDIAKTVFHAHGADERGGMVFSRRLSRAKLLDFFAKQPACLVGIEACGSAHHWARELTRMGHEVRLIPPAYVKPFVKRHKNDAVDAEAICEAVQRPGMRFVAVKSEEQQAAGMVFRTRDLIVRQRTQLINALRGHLAEYGWVAPRGLAQVAMLADLLDEEEMTSSLPEAARAMLRVMTDMLAELDDRIADLDKEIARRAREDEVARRLMTIPGIGPIAATAIVALAPPPETFTKGRDFAAWLGLAPLQHSTGGKQKLGRISKMGERTIRRLLIIGGSSVVRQASVRGAPAGSWLDRMLARKPRMLVSVALANKMARTAWALMTRNEDYRAPAVGAA
ncbi:IS110 family transposase [Sphingobium yanoikuyae]|uniref:IS110 family transposase n=1 Tax=Sphingobium yanoikuyae TaxID=13690 RepID=A0AA43BCH7_SPHYA|nr:IS110 family transposase [Sphingobium yanoikuyae]MDH2134428.1 IS110 family transposase [Sphingobium yanoikuyae]MDH2151115.1 IS110 family transposase [Sphingobium yanoikuyae]MDH2169833.1 IS110 family transposase [Sphingobium yanoikuyae]